MVFVGQAALLHRLFEQWIINKKSYYCTPIMNNAFKRMQYVKMHIHKSQYGLQHEKKFLLHARIPFFNTYLFFFST